MGFKGVELLWLSNCCNLVFLNGSKKKQNLIRIALKWLVFFLKHHKNCRAVKILIQDPSLRYASFEQFSRHAVQLRHFASKKISIFRLINPPPLTKFKLQSVAQPRTLKNLSLLFFLSKSLGKLNSHMQCLNVV